MPLPDQHVGHPAAAWVDEESADLPDVAIGGMNVVAAALFHLARRDDIDGFHFRDPEDGAALHGWLARTAPAGGKQLNRDPVAGHEIRECLLRGLEALELRLGAEKPDLALRLDHDMGHRAGGRIDDCGQYLTAVPVTAHSVSSDRERYH